MTRIEDAMGLIRAARRAVEAEMGCHAVGKGTSGTLPQLQSVMKHLDNME